LRDRLSPSHSALGRYDANKERIVPLRVSREGVMGIRPRNKEQTYALDLLLDDSVRLVTLVGKAGTGKTLLALAGGSQANGRGSGLLSSSGEPPGHAPRP